MKRAIATICAAIICAGGCTSYYKVHDPTTGKDYYATELKQKSNGSATLKDGRTGNTVTIQNSEVAQISKEEYDAGRYSTPKQGETAGSPNPFK